MLKDYHLIDGICDQSIHSDCSHTDIFSSTIIVSGTLPADSDGQCEIATLASGTPASFKTPLLKPLASALRAYFLSNPIESCHPALKRGLSPYNGNGSPWNHPGTLLIRKRFDVAQKRCRTKSKYCKQINPGSSTSWFGGVVHPKPQYVLVLYMG